MDKIKSIMAQGSCTQRIRHIHFTGIGGVGMSGIAEVLLQEGYRISGSDAQPNPLSERLSALGASVFYTHAAENIAGADVVVTSTAIPANNPEVIAAKQAGIALLPRGQMLAELMRFRYGIAISGTHGKTTTTSLLASIFVQAEADPTFVIGGRLMSTGSNASLGAGKHLITEADESDASFLCLSPVVAIVTNIDREHMKTYDNDEAVLEASFLKFLRKLPFYGLAVLCVDDPRLKKMADQLTCPCVTYGIGQGDIQAVNIRAEGLKTRFIVRHPEGAFEVILNLPGKHNVQNALAAIAVALHEGVSEQAIVQALSAFAGTGRRFQIHGGHSIDLFGRSVTLVDDYGHHPKEVQVTLEAMRLAMPGRRIVHVFQPHRYTRTQGLFHEFSEALTQADTVLLLPVYAAGEAPIVGADSQALAHAVTTKGGNASYVSGVAALYEQLEVLLEEGDVLLLQGAGNIGKIAVELSECVQTRQIA